MGIMYLGLILRGMGVACISATKFGMIADSIEYGEYKTGTRAEGFVYSAASLGVRVGSALEMCIRDSIYLTHLFIRNHQPVYTFFHFTSLGQISGCK